MPSKKFYFGKIGHFYTIIYHLTEPGLLSKFELVFQLEPIEITNSYTLSKLAIISCSLDYQITFVFGHYHCTLQILEGQCSTSLM